MEHLHRLLITELSSTYYSFTGDQDAAYIETLLLKTEIVLLDRPNTQGCWLDWNNKATLSNLVLLHFFNHGGCCWHEYCTKRTAMWEVGRIAAAAEDDEDG